MYKQRANILQDQTQLLLTGYGFHPSVHSAMNVRREKGWRFFVVNQSRGRCYYNTQEITIPLFAFRSKKEQYLTWYVAHELAHTYAGFENHHNAVFMAHLKRICPIEAIGFEFNYKPRAAVAAGILPNVTDEELF